MTDEEWQNIADAMEHALRHGAITRPMVEPGAVRRGLESGIEGYNRDVSRRTLNPKGWARRCGEIERAAEHLLEILDKEPFLSPAMHTLLSMQPMTEADIERALERERQFADDLQTLRNIHREHREKYEDRSAPARPDNYRRDYYWRVHTLRFWEMLGGGLSISTSNGKAGGTLPRFLHACIEAADPGAWTVEDAAAFVKAEQYRRRNMEIEDDD